MTTSHSPLIGSIFERKPQSKPNAPTFKASLSGKTGFPSVQHRSKSAFARAREEQKKGEPSKPQYVPVVQPTMKVEIPKPRVAAKPASGESGDWRRQIEEENRRRVDTMTDEEREQERREILEKFGPDVGEILRKAREARERKERPIEGAEEIPMVPSPPNSPPLSADGRTSRPSSPPQSALSRPGTRPSSRADRRIRFAELAPTDIHVYESAPPSPRKKALALPPPSPADGPTTSLGEWKGNTGPIRRRDAQAPAVDHSATTVNSLGEGTPEDIRRRFFPTAPAHDPSLEWIEGGPSSAAPQSTPEPDSTLRFDLTGTPIPPELSATLPTHLGLHHHADGDRAGYTLEDVFWLSRSTVPAQRATMLGVLGRIIRRLGKGRARDPEQGITQLQGQAEAVRKRALATGVEAMVERGGVGARAIEVMWECIVGWDEDVIDVEGVELQAARQPDSSPSTSDSKGEDILTSLPLEYVLAQISNSFSAGAQPAETLAQLLAILHRLAQHTNAIANSIVPTTGLVANVIQRFLLTPFPPTDSTPRPDPSALQLLNTLASASRTNASALLDPADALLRFVTTLPPASPYPLALATALLNGTLHLYTVFASYGLYSHIATTASEHLTKLGQYVLSEECRSRQLREAWLALLEAWMVCARDPHRTSPGHEILWSQVAGWGWGDDILEIRERLAEEDAAVWTALWRAAAAWLEGAKINGVKGGEKERGVVIAAVQDQFRDGLEKIVVENSGRTLSTVLGQLATIGVRTLQPEDLPKLQEMAEHASRLAAALRLWLACVSPQSSGPPDSPPFQLPFRELSDLCAQITTHPIWDSALAQGSVSYGYAFCKSLSLLLCSYLQLSPHMPGVSDALWMAQALAILSRLLPGDEEAARHIVDLVTSLITPSFMGARGWTVPPVIWRKGGMDAIKPFLAYSLRPKEHAYIGPQWISPDSISLSTTQRLPPAGVLVTNTRRTLPLPLTRDWMCSPLDHLLRSGDSDVFKSLPSSWDASETEVVRACLLLARVVREVAQLHGLQAFAMSREETIFSCMKVYMLEHGQQHNDSTEEVFRDKTVGQFMEDLMAPFSASASTSSLVLPRSRGSAPSLESVATRFLGSGTPFYQFYTDFVALYDAISFSHPLFARLLLPPTSMRYPIDYRKYLWADYGHLLKTVRTPVEAVLTGSLGEYLWPVERDPEVVGAYLRALVKGLPEGFLRFVAVHHVACNIWQDLSDTTDEKAQRLLKAVVDQGSLDVIREVVCYRQVREGTVLLPPQCFTQKGEWRSRRLDFVTKTGGPSMADRLKGLFADV
ncbi:uncharacterized protein B0H18DRAFT_1016327 [Fomitopsis serialis]|uniref:uncharacterized protein n=1 Tax=Fomitopsis serialis TaxID=139415 RepID=UPI002007A96B|nr:uncharacterized protein B0H18DRAFT_1016327 [Neoantrodia serialis]KAH9922952.1 hypothetical protein B0H18DRAFT_1016327 [Neoantrodia serialis]